MFGGVIGGSSPILRKCAIRVIQLLSSSFSRTFLIVLVFGLVICPIGNGLPIAYLSSEASRASWLACSFWS